LAVPVKLDPAGDQLSPCVVVDRSEKILVVWLDKSGGGQRIMLQGFDREGGRLGSIGTANTNPGLSPGAPSVAVDFDGTAVVAWSEEIGAGQRILFRRCEMSGQLLGSLALPRSTERTLYGRSPSVAVDSAGNAILVWEGPSGEDTDIIGTWIAHHDSAGEANLDSAQFAWIGNIIVNRSRQGNQSAPAVAADREGNFVVVWRDTNPDSLGIRARAFYAGGIALEEFKLHWPDSLPTDSISAPSITAVNRAAEFGRFPSDSSHFLVSWIDYSDSANKAVVVAKVSIAFGWGTVSQDTLLVERSSMLSGLDKPVVSGNENAVAVLLWRDKSNCEYTLYSTGFNLDKGPATVKTPLTPDSCAAGVPWIGSVAAAIKQEGGFAVVWEEHAASGVDLLMQSFTAQGDLSAPFFIAPGFVDDVVNRFAALVPHADGGFTLFWERGAGEDDTHIESIRFSGDGKPRDQGLPLQGGYRVQTRPAAANNKAGGYLIAWQEHNAAGSYRLRTMLFGADELPLGNAFLVEESSRDYLSGLAAALDDNGQALLVWERWKPYASAGELVLGRYNSAGQRVGSLDIVADPASGGGRLASVAVNSSGYQMVVWRQGAAQGMNACVRGRVYDSRNLVKRSAIRISESRHGYLGGVGRPVVAASTYTENFLVVWQEFFGENQRLYYTLYDSTGANLPFLETKTTIQDTDTLVTVDSTYRRSFGSDLRALTNPSVSIDGQGDYLIIWAEKERGASTFIKGQKLDSRAETVGSVFQVPGVEMGALPVFGSLGGGRFAVAWLDTLGHKMRVMAQVLEIEFHTVGGKVKLPDLQSEAMPVMAHIEGNVSDSVAVDGRGYFSFTTLVAGNYRFWLTSGGDVLPAELSAFSLKAGDPPAVDLGLVANLDDAAAAARLPRSRGFALHQNAPNPFNPSTAISFELGDEKNLRQVTLSIYDLRGRLVLELFSGQLDGGSHSFTWKGTDSRGRPVASGIYLYRLKAGSEVAVRKMILIK